MKLRYSLFSIMCLAILSACDAALAEQLWGISVSRTDENLACELKAPVRFRYGMDNVWDSWIGFYWLRKESEVPGHIISAGRLVFAIEIGKDLSSPTEFVEPINVDVLDQRLRRYAFPSVRESVFFFDDGELADELFERALSGAAFEIDVEPVESQTGHSTTSFKAEDDFPIYANMLFACGEALAE